MFQDENDIFGVTFMQLWDPTAFMFQEWSNYRWVPGRHLIVYKIVLKKLHTIPTGISVWNGGLQWPPTAASAIGTPHSNPPPGHVQSFAISATIPTHSGSHAIKLFMALLAANLRFATSKIHAEVSATYYNQSSVPVDVHSLLYGFL